MYALTSSKIDRFSNLFHCPNLETMAPERIWKWGEASIQHEAP